MISGRRIGMLIGVIAPVSVSAQEGAVLRGRVLVDSTELPVKEATVLLSGQALLTTTDSLGRFRLSGIAPGTHDVLVRQIGFAPFYGMPAIPWRRFPRRRCPVGTGLDGAFVAGFNIDWLQPSEVAAVEWYAGPAQMPVRFNTSRIACGFLMIWTR